MYDIGELEVPADEGGSHQEVIGHAEEQRRGSSRSVNSAAPAAEEGADAEERHSETTRTAGGGVDKDPQLIHPNNVLKALRAFVEDYNKNKQK